MPLPDEYDTWRCHECKGLNIYDMRDCKTEWQVCDQCNNGILNNDEECGACSGAGGGHICIHDEEFQ